MRILDPSKPSRAAPVRRVRVNRLNLVDQVERIQRFVRLRQEMRISQAELSPILGWSYTKLSQVECRARRASEEELQRMEAVLTRVGHTLANKIMRLVGEFRAVRLEEAALRRGVKASAAGASSVAAAPEAAEEVEQQSA